MGKFIGFLIITSLLWLGLGLWVFYGTEFAGEMEFFETIFKSPVIIFDVIKQWIMGL